MARWNLQRALSDGALLSRIPGASLITVAPAR
jgi:hypothetical protein